MHRLLLLIIALVAGCASTPSVELENERTAFRAYVKGDEQTLEVVGASWQAYVEADATKDELEKRLARSLVRSWRIRVKERQGK